VIGSPEFAEDMDKQNALDLRHHFKINLCGIVNSQNEVEWWPSADKTIREGDRGLLMRVPNFIGKRDEEDEEVGGCSADTEMLKCFLDPVKFYQTLGLEEDSIERESWKTKSRSRDLI